MANKLEIDEAEANFIQDAVVKAIESRRWDPLDESDWTALVAYKSLLARVERFLDNEE